MPSVTQVSGRVRDYSRDRGPPVLRPLENIASEVAYDSDRLLLLSYSPGKPLYLAREQRVDGGNQTV